MDRKARLAYPKFAGYSEGILAHNLARPKALARNETLFGAKSGPTHDHL